MSLIKRTRGYNRNDLVILADQVGELARDANRELEALVAADVTLAAAVAAAAAAGGSGAAFDGAYLNFYSTDDITWSSSTWTGVHNAATLSNRVSSGISRSNSTITFTEAGTYAIAGQGIVRRSGSSTGFWGYRMRNTGSGVTVACGAVFVAGANLIPITGVFTVTASQALDIQYCAGGTAASGTAGTIDSEVLPSFDCSIWRVA